MIYACIDCGFLFYRAGEVERCPSCEGIRLRSATEEEAISFHRLVEHVPVKQNFRRP